MVPITEIFFVRYGNQFDFSKMEISNHQDAINFISRSSKDNGFVAKVEPYLGYQPFAAGDITVTMGGSYLLASFVQPEPFYTAQNIKVLTPLQTMTLGEKLYYCAAIQHNRFKYHSHSREANATFDSLLVPSRDQVPKEYMTDTFPIIDTSPLINCNLELNNRPWRWFTFDCLFDIRKGKRLTKADMTPGKIPFIGAIDNNNGISAYISNEKYIHSPNTITVSYNGSVAEAFYQDRPFWATDDVNVLYPKFMLNSYIAIFLTTLIHREKFRFNYGRKWDKETMRKSKLKLPIKSDGTPDWEFMENYIKSLPYSSNI